ncbi:chromosome segregation protein SMC [Varunaivibrio sulfuroxidans]|uniref:Chromosome partition protein Smc n=1 Tax=Varunaivibrio sulfuroxidans TaxID=1773489 RepID=A0A4R3JC38_9PROT|nr:chromosome segregation protein SMC [Varunaivibrio sulfuroxidans]TCS62210.1 condensin subunit Smc [Varunaivibrio sulfuroxidans]WES30635.1 chromosome segregation protein SMC [Varunaivibrio sulfuroxidans]
MRFKKLRLSGFKSFVDPSELHIEQGLTGIVGPNGCGKSNLVEALKWVMGETSAKQMRGAEMDNVIFGGSANRPQRNVAEVVLHIDNTSRRAPAQFNDSDELEVSRRIERERGSVYKINGKDVRAKDVHLLFADAASGARSAALVSQGRISALISAKPKDRRMLLEEAAGITGLHSRRHEAELRLRGAESNLERLDDILVTLENQLQSLKKQARQAVRYRNLSDHIRKAEATLFYLRWVRALEHLDNHRTALKSAQDITATLTAKAAEISRGQLEAAEILPQLRMKEAEIAAQLQRLSIARDTLEHEEHRIAEAIATNRQRRDQVAGDIERERTLSADAERAIVALSDEATRIESERAGEAQARLEAEARLEKARRTVAEMEVRHTELTEKVAADEAERAALARTLREQQDREARLDERCADLARQYQALQNDIAAADGLLKTERDMEQAQNDLNDARDAREHAGAAHIAAREAFETARALFEDKRAARTALEAEERALAQILEHDAGQQWPPLVDDLHVAEGYENALGAALGEDLTGATDPAAPMHWRTLPPYDAPQALPEGVRALAAHVQGPPAITRSLEQIGVVKDDAQGDALHETLYPGQRLVSRDGALWRWDGFTIRAGAPTASAIRLEQRNRLRLTRERLQSARAKEADGHRVADDAENAMRAAQQSETDARAHLRRCEDALGVARETMVALQARTAEQTARIANLETARHAALNDLDETRGHITSLQTEVAALANVHEDRDEVNRVRAQLAERRTVHIECQSAYNSLQRTAEERARRFADIHREIATWRDRDAGATRRIDDLTARIGDLESELQELTVRPGEIEARRRELLSQIEDHERRRKSAADRLAEAETGLAEIERHQRNAEVDLAKARETRVRAEGLVEQGKQACAAIAERVGEHLGCTPDELATLGEIDENAPLADMEATERKVERLVRERDTMGPVNLRAEREAHDMDAQIETLTDERSDLIAAIEKLRHAIAELNGEGRTRLRAAFKDVDRHFQQLFVRLFGGGNAHLTLTDSDDPLEAGLEIMASPPGKRMQTLSLLSGGEQALTALALLFGVFLTNPAPICVLDEVDAPLDDANVDRFCTLLEEMAESTGTRFLTITHHRMTMARMERLFGVTMAERGISQLVSVDLERAEELRESAQAS